MGAFSKSASFIPQLNQTVRVNNALTNLIECVGYDARSATFRAPELVWDTRRENLRDGRVSVTADGSPAFSGYLDVDSATEEPDEANVSFTASSVSAYLSKVWVGQTERVPVKTYTLSETMNPKGVLKDLFDNLPADWRSRIKLGNTSVLNDNDIQTPPTLVFRNTTYQAAIDQVAELFGDVAYTERHVGNVTYIDFYRVQASGAPRTVANVANWGDSVLTANVEEISEDVTSSDCVTRVIFYGAPRKFIVSCITDHADPLKALVKDWDATLEAAVMADPKKAKPKAPGYLPGMEYVFRRYRLPEIFRAYTKVKALPFKRSNGNEYKPQAWLYPTVLINDTEGDDDKVGVLQLTPALASNAKFELEQNQVIFNEPALNITTVSKDPDTNKPVKTYVEAQVGITFCFESHDYLYYDTGHDYGSDVDMDFMQSEGLVDSLHREDLYYAQYTNVGYPLVNLSAGVSTPLEFGAVIFNEDIPSQPALTINDFLLVNDDTAILRRLALEKQRERSKRHRTYTVKVPYYTRAYREGYLLRIAGQRNYVPDNYMITGVQYNLEENSTTITADNVKPPARQEVTV